jgi:hypothetical protein
MPPAIAQPPVVVMLTGNPELAAAETANDVLNGAVDGACAVTVIVWLVLDAATVKVLVSRRLLPVQELLPQPFTVHVPGSLTW